MYIEVLFNVVVAISALIVIYNRNEKSFNLSQGLIHHRYLFVVVPIVYCFTLGDLTLNTIIAIFISFKLRINLVPNNLGCINYKYINSLIQKIIILWPILVFVSIVSKMIFSEFTEQNIVKDVRKLNNFYEFLTVFIMVVIVAPVIEEILFRGLIYRVFKGLVGPFIAAFISSILFSFVHINLLSFPYLFIFGIVLCTYYEKENTIVTPILIHSIFNGIMLTLILVTR